METPPISGSDDSAASGRDALDHLRTALGADYEVLRLLGRGAVASVYLARDRVLGVMVAIKVLDPARASDETTRRRFEREARAAAALAEHPHVAAVRRFGRLSDETPYLVMQYVKGRTMAERLAAEGRLDVATARTILREVASALEVAHTKGFVHRDVRPGNVLWDEEAGKAVLTDFGIAGVVANSLEETTRLTQTGQVLGDPRYMSPEQLLDQEVTEFTDIYLLGVLGYELLTGEGPYAARNTMEWITAHVQKEPKDIRELRTDVDADTAGLLLRCLARQPKHRPSAADVVRALGGGGSATGPAAASAPDDLTELVKRRVPQIVLLTAGAGITLIGLADALEDLLPANSKLLTVVFVVAAVIASAVIGWFHGEKGRQRAPAVEYLLLSLIGLGWLVVTVWVVVAS